VPHQQILSHFEASSVLRSLEEECDHPDLPFITDDEALILLDQIAPFNPTIACLIIPSRFPNSKLRLLTQVDLQKLLQHRSWQYHKSARYNHDDSVLELRIFVMFVYHAYINAEHYQSSQVLCEDLSIQLTDILHKLHTEALNLLNMELYARNKLIPGPDYIVTSTRNERLFIMVCRHFAYAGTIDKILPFREEFESIMLETCYYNRPLYQALHGLLIPFRVGRLPVSDNYDPNKPALIAADPKRTYLSRLNRMLRHTHSTIYLFSYATLQPILSFDNLNFSDSPSPMTVYIHSPYSWFTTPDHVPLLLSPITRNPAPSWLLDMYANPRPISGSDPYAVQLSGIVRHPVSPLYQQA
jgi:hypothetical protein